MTFPSAHSPEKQQSSFVMFRGRGLLLHLFRVGLVATIVGLIHDAHQSRLTRQHNQLSDSLTVEAVHDFFPAAASLGDSPQKANRGGRGVFDSNGHPLGTVLQTMPGCSRIVGYSGPSNLLIAFNVEGKILGIRILSSGDTRDHVDAIRRSKQFLESFNGLTWDEAAQKRDVHAVSGATLTSLAMFDSVTHRLGGGQPSLRFPEEVALAEVQPFFPRATRLRLVEGSSAKIECLDDADQPLGFIMRTTPAADTVMGYQGPTDSLLAFDASGRSIGAVIRKSFDNEPYVGYVRQDVGFLSLFEGKTLDELSRLDRKAEQIEGVSGATMTSVSIADALPLAARSLREADAKRTPQTSSSMAIWGYREISTIGITLFALVMGFQRWRGNRWIRWLFQLVLVVHLGLINGDLVSQSLLVGWSQNGISARYASSLLCLAAAAIITPIVSRTNLYCHHLCPFGAAQQLVKLRVSRPIRLPRWLLAGRQVIPAVLLMLVLATAFRFSAVDLSSIEPFDAFNVRIAGIATVAIAIVGLLASLFVPMAYCRFGCPTGSLLEFLRWNSASDRFTLRDGVAVVLLLLAVGFRGGTP